MEHNNNAVGDRVAVKGGEQKKVNIAVLVSGGGTNLQALIDFERAGKLKSGKLALVVSSKSDAFALERAKNAGIPTVIVPRKEAGEAFEPRILAALDEYKIDMIVYAGFLSILSADFCARYENRMINVHPALLPSFGGRGYYGLRVHEAALAAGVKLTGATVHYVTAECDGGAIIAQKAIAVRADDTPERLQKRVMERCEWVILPRAAETVARGLLCKKAKFKHI